MSKERGPFFVVETHTDNGPSFDVMSESEVMDDESVVLASGACDTREEAEAELRNGMSDGTYSA